MTLQRMARESSEQTLLASQEFRGFLNTLPLQDMWTEHTWNGNSFKAKKEHGYFLIEYKEYRTNQTVGTYTFSRKGKLAYFLTPREKIEELASFLAPFLILILLFVLFIGFPATALTLAAARPHAHFTIPGSLIPYVLCLISLAASIFISTNSITNATGKILVSISVFALIVVICMQFGPYITPFFPKVQI
ncbi:hypothetical protein [Ethanoligenens harbinense]|uniref:Uncharacterized protein n=1 Tax=Ethanoligenens harbinense (strain DSM 18485 / JCM 12961 / CGMCC 1.5033 / YUAN-3) TaxID=663278 RepID=E6U5U0_ETHHY|nr:hypothetical protein [Ethanoligenens harbinense]ADU27957.1 hypothetical protein Ethha_2463 [Ethanoligenens harbinense YUAN-3]AVQ96986.1 hypothetical protein CXQ68_12650 [Ethanoligenens harbinense YUAN-3]AYF39646.1 hypothetical protein CXP51_12545 [Ethanoligenens harbinense]AYF42474.1 hypothetical protein CN246_13100 [Ethanoligenens harbinense]QCN93227.1 hypothetical protein DRA42_12695 [Ethanoligenens harbinense]